MANIVLARNCRAEAAIAACTIVRFGAADFGVVTATAANQGLIGVTTDIAAATGERCDVILSGIADVVYGGTVARGDLLTSDAQGRAITATAAPGTNVRIIGFAMTSGVLGDIGQVNLEAGSFQG